MGSRKHTRQKDFTTRYLAGSMDEDRIEPGQKFGDKTKHFQKGKIERTAQLRLDAGTSSDLESLPTARVLQVYSLFSQVECAGRTLLCTIRKTLHKRRDTSIVVGDFVRIRPSSSPQSTAPDPDQPEAVIEQIMPRKTVLTRADSFKAIEQHPIVANAEQMLIVASLHAPEVKWGLIDRMVIAGRSGGLAAVLCINKIDTAEKNDRPELQAILSHYQSLGVRTLCSSVQTGEGIDELRQVLQGKETVLAGHSGVGKSSLINAIEPALNLRTGLISAMHQKGIHTTTSARIYPLTMGGAVIDTPGVKLFGLWQITQENLIDFFPDIEAGTAPTWRAESYERIRESLA